MYSINKGFVCENKGLVYINEAFIYKNGTFVYRLFVVESKLGCNKSKFSWIEK